MNHFFNSIGNYIIRDPQDQEKSAYSFYRRQIFLEKTLFTLTVIAVSLSLIFGYLYAVKNFKSFITKTLASNLKAKVSVGYIGLGFPLHLELKNIKIDDSIDIKGINIYLCPESFLLKNKLVVLDAKIVEPIIRMKEVDNIGVGTSIFLKSGNNKPPSLLPRGFIFCFSRIVVENGTLVYNPGNETSIECCKIRGVFENPSFYFAKDYRFIFKAIGFFKNQNSGFLSPFEISGWIDRNAALNANLKADKMDFQSLGPIYAKYFKDVVTKGRVDFCSTIFFLNNVLRADCSLKVDNIIFKNASSFKMKEPLIMNFILGINFSDNLVRITNLEGNFLSVILGTH